MSLSQHCGHLGLVCCSPTAACCIALLKFFVRNRRRSHHGMGCWSSALLCITSACLAVVATVFVQQYRLDQVPLLDEPRAVPSLDLVSNQQPAQDGTTHDQAIDVAQALDLGRVLLTRGEPEEAALAFRVAAKATGERRNGRVATAEAKHGLGLALRAAGRASEALDACREAERLNPQLAVASICVGSLLTEAGAWESALVALRRAVELEPDAAEPNGSLGAALVATGQADEAISILARAMAANPRDSHATYNLGVAWQSKGETNNAIAAYARSVELEPTFAPARINLGAQLLKADRLRDAESMLLMAIKFADDAESLAAAHANLGGVYERTRRTEQALEAYSQAVKWGGGREYFVRMARLYHDLGRQEEALQASQRALADGGELVNPSMLGQAGLLLEEMGRFEEATDFFVKAVQLDVGNLEANVRLGNCQLRLGRFHDALESFVRAIRLDPGNLEIYNLLHSALRGAQIAAGAEAGGDFGPSSGEEASDDPAFETSMLDQAGTRGGDTLHPDLDEATYSQYSLETPVWSDTLETVGGSMEGCEIDLVDKQGDPEKLDILERELVNEEPSGVVSTPGLLPEAQDLDTEISSYEGLMPKSFDASDSVGSGARVGFAEKFVGEASSVVAVVGEVEVGISTDDEVYVMEAEELEGGDIHTGEARIIGSRATCGTCALAASYEGAEASTCPSNTDISVSATDSSLRDTSSDLPSDSGVVTMPELSGNDTSESLFHSMQGDLAEMEVASGESTAEVASMTSGGSTSDFRDMSLAMGKAHEDRVHQTMDSQELIGAGDGVHVDIVDAGAVAIAREYDGGNAVPDPVPCQEAESCGSPSHAGSDHSTNEAETAASSEGGETLPPGQVLDVGSSADSHELQPESDLADAPAELQEFSSTNAFGFPLETVSGIPSTADSASRYDSSVDIKSDQGAVDVSDRVDARAAESASHMEGTENTREADGNAPSSPGIAKSAPGGDERDAMPAKAEDSYVTAIETVAQVPGVDVLNDTILVTGPADDQDQKDARESEDRAKASVSPDEENIVSTAEVGLTEATPSSGSLEKYSTEEQKMVAPSEDEEKVTQGNSTSSIVESSLNASSANETLPGTISEEDERRARSKVKLGLARLQKDQVIKAIALFDRAAAIDPNWWGGSYYAAVARHRIGDAEGAAKALISALRVYPPSEDEEVPPMSDLASKILTSLSHGKESEGEKLMDDLKGAVEAAGLKLDDRPGSVREPRDTTSGKDQIGGSAVDRAAGMGTPQGADRAKGKVTGGLENDSSQAAGFEQRRWPFRGGSSRSTSARDTDGVHSAGDVSQDRGMGKNAQEQSLPPASSAARHGLSERGDAMSGEQSILKTPSGGVGSRARGTSDPADNGRGAVNVADEVKGSRHDMDPKARQDTGDGSRTVGWGGGGWVGRKRGTHPRDRTQDSGELGDAELPGIDPSASAEEILASLGLSTGIMPGLEGSSRKGTPFIEGLDQGEHSSASSGMGGNDNNEKEDGGGVMSAIGRLFRRRDNQQ